jgi:hypothetical protein
MQGIEMIQARADIEPIEAFVFCWYQEHWLPRAVIVDYHKLDDWMRDKIQLLLKTTGPLIQKNYHIEKNDNRRSISYSLVNYTNVQENKIIDPSDELDEIINTWEHHSDNLHSYYFDDDDDHEKWIDHTYEYYINDENSNYAPHKLHEVLASMTKLPLKKIPMRKRYDTEENDTEKNDAKENDTEEKSDDKDSQRTIFNSEFVVKHCILVSDIPMIKDQQVNMKPIRFFFRFSEHDQIEWSLFQKNDCKIIKVLNNHQIPDTEKISDKELLNDFIEEVIKKSLNVSDISLADKVYGFLTPIDINQFQEFNNACYQIKFKESEMNLFIVFA